MAKTLKKLLSLVIAVIMVLSLIPAVSAAEETTTPAYTTNAGGWVEIEEASEFNKWFHSKGTSSEYILPTATESITAKLVLTGDIVMNVTGSMGKSDDTFGHNIVLDLNGHTITATHTSRIMSAYHGTLTIMNSKEEGGIIAKGANNAAVIGNMIYAGFGATLNLVNLNITREENTHLSKSGGVIGCTDGGTVNIIDCVIDGNNTGYSEAGGVVGVQSNGTINFFSGTIKNGTALKGANVYVNSLGTFNMYGGEICGGYLPATTFGTEKANTAANGAGVYVTSTGVFNMYGGEIHDNTSAYGYSRGGNVYVYDDASAKATPVFNMYGGKVYNGDSMLGDNVYIYADKGAATVNFYGGEVGAAKTGTDARNNIYINKACSVCNVYGGTFKFLPATAGSAILNTAECATYTEATEEADHIYTHGTAGETVAATCVTPGYTAYSCATCQKEWKVYTGLAAHTPATKAGVAGTCTADGLSEGAYCTVCNYDLIPQLTVKGGHTYEVSYTSPEAMNSVGTYVYTCSVCGDSYQEADTLTRDTEIGELDITDKDSTSAANSRGTHIFVRVTGLDPEKTNGFIAVKVYAGEKLLATTVRPAEKPLMLEFAPINIEINRDTINWDTTWVEGALSADLVPTHFEVYYGDLETVRGIFAFSFTAEDWAAHPGVANGGQHYPMEPVKENEVPQTCETAGSYDLVIYCEQCDLEISRETVEVPVHTPEVIPAVEATCTATGLTEGSKCSVCGEILTAQEEIEATGHSMSFVDGYQAGCDYSGMVPHFHCVTCGGYFADEAGKQPIEDINISATGHELKFVEAKAATCVNPGNVAYYYCAVCGSRFEDDQCKIPVEDPTIEPDPDAHEAGEEQVELLREPTCMAPAIKQIQVFCVHCNGTLRNEVVEDTELAPHTEEVVPGKAATCTEAGLTDGIVCSVCDAVIKAQEEIAAPGHSWAQETEYKKVCSACGEIEEEIPQFAIVAEPENITVKVNENATFTVRATGAGLTYQWYYCRPNGTWYKTKLDGYSTEKLTVAALAARNGYQYKCVVTDEAGNELVTEVVTLTVETAQLTVSAPESVTAQVGQNVTFTVGQQNDAYTYRWQYSRDGEDWYNTKLEGYNTATLTVAVLAGRNGYQYRCVVSDGAGTEVTTEVATLTVQRKQIIVITQPGDASVAVGENAVFTVVTEGNVNYQWQYSRNGETWHNTALTGCKTNELTVAALAGRNGYQYRCILTDDAGNRIYTEVATLTVG